MKEERYDISEELLFRRFAGETNSSENDAIDQWISESEENRQEFERINILFLDLKATSKVGKEDKPYDIIQAWEKVKEKRSGKTEKKGVQLPFSFTSMRIAAAVVLLIIACWIGYDKYYATNDITIATLDSTKGQMMVDGSSITLNKNSELSYSEEFGKTSRNVSLNGEAHFDVEPDLNRPFVITAGVVEIEVLGTAFNVNAYDLNDSLVVSVDHGKVSMKVGDNEEILAAGNIGIFIKSTNRLISYKFTSVGMHNYWRTKLLVFDRAPLNEVAKAIEGTYGKKVLFDNPKIGMCKISVSFEDESVENILNIISATLDLQWILKNESYIISGEGCE